MKKRRYSLNTTHHSIFISLIFLLSQHNSNDRNFLYLSAGFVFWLKRRPHEIISNIEFIHLIVCKATEDAKEFENAFQLSILFFGSSERLYISFWQNVRCNLHTIRPCALILIPSSNLSLHLNRQIMGWSG